jgi:putative membrane protein
MMWGWGDSLGGWLAMVLMMLLFWGGIVALVVFVLRSTNQRDDDRVPAKKSDARSILEERFAKGEISEDEFEQRRRVLERTGS